MGLLFVVIMLQALAYSVVRSISVHFSYLSVPDPKIVSVALELHLLSSVTDQNRALKRTDIICVLSNVAMMGGLVMILAESKDTAKYVFAGVPMVS